jgi:hypothetical protein
MNGTLELTHEEYKIKKKWSKKTQLERNQGIDKLLDEILGGRLPYDIIEDKKFEAVILAKMILRRSSSKE